MQLKHILISALVLFAAISCGRKQAEETRYLASPRPSVLLYSYCEDEDVPQIADTVVRGTEVRICPGDVKRIGKHLKYVHVKVGKNDYYADENSLCTEPRACVQEASMFVRTPASIIPDTLTAKVGGLAPKGAELTICDYDTTFTDGRVRRYKVSYDGTEGYVYGKYLVFDKAEADAIYRPDFHAAVHANVRNPFGGGRAEGCDFYPVEKPSFKDNVMPESCYSIYLNISPAVIGNIDAYIRWAKETRINTFVIDIKDDQCPGYRADAMKKHSPTSWQRAGANKEQMYAKAVRRLHEEGFYVVGRITCFKDTYFVKDHPEAAITDAATGKPYLHNKSYWPSAFDRSIWQYNVELALEAVRKFGFNEINFDYVRFPDRMTGIEDKIDYHSRYGESKVQAIQRFVAYACDEIHAAGAYVSIDVFGECAGGGYTTAYGQYWPALSNIVDVMCGMPYPDHFANNSYGIQQPWNHPYQILYAWGSRVMDRQKETATPARVRTWIQCYHVMKHVDPNGIDYNAENVEKEIRGLFDAGCTGGFMTWQPSSSLEKYRSLSPAFSIDYLHKASAAESSDSSDFSDEPATSAE